LFAGISNAQPYLPNKIIPPAPTTASLGKYGNVPVSFYNGMPNISIPLYEIKTSNHSLNLSMQYDASGTKAMQDASWVGLGWSLNAGGVISRIVRQQDDFMQHGYYFASALPAVNDNSSTAKAYMNDVYFGNIDAEPDIYSYNFAGYSGRFVLGKKANGSPVFLDEKNNLKIEYLDTQGKWLITNAEGYKYYFSTSERAQDYYNSALFELTNLTGVNGFNMNLNSFPITGWFLDSIVSPAGETISFTYVKGKSLSLINKSETFINLNGITPGPCDVTRSPVLGGGSRTYDASRQVLTDVYLKTIKFATGSIDFNVSARSDIEYINASDGLINPSKLDNIIVRNNAGIQIKKYTFSYGYFNSASTSGRLKLDAITEYGNTGTSKPPFAFTYHNPSSLPDKYSKSIDHWGYGNGKANSTLLPSTDLPSASQSFVGANRDPDTLGILPVNGVLIGIKYPTGGSTFFEYELNEYANLHDEQQYRMVNKYAEVRSNSLNPSGNVVDANFTIRPRLSPVLPNGKIPVEIRCSYQKIDAGVSDIVSLGYSNMWRIKSDNSLESVSGCTSANYDQPNPGPTFTNRNFDPGNYKMNLLATNGWSFFMSISWQEQELITQRKGGGIRIKRIEDQDQAGNTTVKKFLYTANNGKSSGVLLSYPKYDVSYNVQDYSANAQGQSCTFIGNYTMIVSSSLYSSGLSSRSGTVGYSKVTELLGENGENGKTEYYFHNNEETVSDFPTVPTFADPLNGKLDSTRYFTAQGICIKKDNYHYLVKQNNSLGGAKLFYDSTPHNTNAPGGLYFVKFYDSFSNWIVNDVKSEIDLSGSKAVANTENYSYDNSTHKEITKIIYGKSDGSQLVKKFKRPNDYAVSGGLSFAEQMSTAGVISPVIEEQTFLVKNGVTSVLSGMFVSYKKYNSKFFRPDVIYKIETKAPLSILTESSFSSSGVPVLHANYKANEYYDLYDLSSGNLLSMHTFAGPSQSFFWGYRSQYPIAKISGADYNTAKQYVDTALLNNPATTTAQLKTELNKIRTGFAGNSTQVSTYTYDPLIGITSSTDGKNMPIYYDYDEFLRLRSIKDQDGNILKSYNYHYKP
jgi:hypothetical protein